MEYLKSQQALDEMKRKGLVCPFTIYADEYKLKNNVDSLYLCWLKTFDYMRQNNTDVVDTLYAECTMPLIYQTCNLFRKMPGL